MPDTLRQQIVDAIKTQLEGILISNGFATDVGTNVMEWLASPLDPEFELPALILRDLDEPVEEHTRHASRHERSLHIQVQIVATGDTPASAYRLMLADVEHAIRNGMDTDAQGYPISWFGGLAYRVRPRLSRLVVEQESYKIAGGFFECFVDYATRAFDSYA